MSKGKRGSHCGKARRTAKRKMEMIKIAKDHKKEMDE